MVVQNLFINSNFNYIYFNSDFLILVNVSGYFVSIFSIESYYFLEIALQITI